MEKKTKLTISGTAKKSFKNIEIAKTQGKNSVVIEKQSSKFPSRSSSSRPGSYKSKTTSTFSRGVPTKPSFVPKSPPITSDFERRKLAQHQSRARQYVKGWRAFRPWRCAAFSYQKAK
jgi:translation initiation factor IF-2